MVCKFHWLVPVNFPFFSVYWCAVLWVNQRAQRDALGAKYRQPSAVDCAHFRAIKSSLIWQLELKMQIRFASRLIG